MSRRDDARARLPQPSRSMSMIRTPTTDIRKRMDDVYNEMTQSASNGRLRMPVKFQGLHQTDVLYQFARAAVGYALSYVKVKTLEKETNEHASAEELAKFQASQKLNQFSHEPAVGYSIDANVHEEADADALLQQQQLQSQQQQLEREALQLRIRQALDSQSACATLLAETYARLVLHCSNYEHHKEDERLFECIYFFTCSVVKIGLPIEHWNAVEDELGFLFRGAQFSAMIKQHTSSKIHRERAVATAMAATQASDAAAKKLQSLTVSSNSSSSSATGAGVLVSPKESSSSSGGGGSGGTRRGRDHDLAPFILPATAPTKCCHFSASLPVGKIVSELDAAKLRATRNIEVSQSIRDRIRVSREDEQQRRRIDAMVSPRANVRLQFDHQTASSTSSSTSHHSAPDQQLQLQLQKNQPVPPSHQGHASHARGSPRLSMKATFTSRSPVVNHLLPGTEDRVRLALQDYERDFQRNRAEQLQQQQQQQQQRHAMAVASSHGDLSSSSSGSSSNASSLATLCEVSPHHTTPRKPQHHFR